MNLPEALTPHLNLWLEQDGQVVLSVWRVQLLTAIDQTGSISAAAERMQVQYRLAWDRLDEMERGARRTVGGSPRRRMRRRRRLPDRGRARSGGSFQRAGGRGGRLFGGTFSAELRRPLT